MGMIKHWLIKKLGGFTLDKLSEVEKSELLNLAVAKSFNIITDKDILRETERGLMWQGQVITKAQMEALRNDARAFENSPIFKLLDAELKHHCQQKMREATTLMELEASKCIEFTWDIIKTRLKRI